MRPFASLRKPVVRYILLFVMLLTQQLFAGTISSTTPPEPPVLSDFSPQAASRYQVVTIRGSHFTYINAIKFGGVKAYNFYQIGDSIIKAYVNKGASGDVIIDGYYGSDTLAGFTFLDAPAISSFTPQSGGTGATITIKGKYFTGISSVKFGRTDVSSYTVTGDSVIQAIVGTGATGYVTVNGIYGGDTLSGFTYIPTPPAPPVINSFSPQSSSANGQVTIYGRHFNNITSVRFGGVEASFLVTGDSIISAIIGNGATGALTITGANGSDTLAGFTFIPTIPDAPVITSFTPQTGVPDGYVTIYGKHFTGITAVQFGGVPSRSFTVTGDSIILAGVGSGASGSVTVTGTYGTASLAGFIYDPLEDPGPTPEPPIIDVFVPQEGSPGDTITIYGLYFEHINSVQFGGITATSFTVYENGSYDSIRAVIGAGASGAVTVNGAKGTATRDGFTFKPTPPARPVITGFTPQTARTGDTVTIYGQHFTGLTAVQFGAEAASSFTVTGDSIIYAIVSSHGRTGYVEVHGINGSAAMAGFVFIPPGEEPAPPVINSFSPQSGRAGDTIIIYGQHFSDITTVQFGGATARSFTINNDSIITAIVHTGATGAVGVYGSKGSYTLDGFTFIPPPQPPVISRFEPQSGGPGDTIIIYGQHLTGTTLVQFGGIAAGSFTVAADSIIEATISTGGTGVVTVNSPYGSGALAGFTFVPPVPEPDAPELNSFIPQSGGPGETIIIYGHHFTGTTAVQFGGIAAGSFTVTSDSVITATIGAGNTGAVMVTGTHKSDSLAGFTFIPAAPDAPVITSFTPQTGVPDGNVTIYGKRFIGITAVQFGGVPSRSFTVTGDSIILAGVGSGASGSVTVTGTYGTASLGGFIYDPLTGPDPTQEPPLIDVFAPQEGSPGDTITIYGLYFKNISSVQFGGITATSFTVYENGTYDSIRAVVGAGATGAISVNSENGGATRDGFTFKPTPPARPVIAGFNPQTARTGDTVTIYGQHFTGLTAVQFGAEAASSFTVTGDSIIHAIVSSHGRSGYVEVHGINGSAAMAGFVFIPPVEEPAPPVITSFSPQSGQAGDTIIIYGQHFSDITAVLFGGVTARSFAINNDSIITAIVHTGATGVVGVYGLTGSDTLNGFTFIPSVPDAPVITSFTPQTGVPDGNVTIYGKRFIGITAVQFGGVPSGPFTVTGDSIILAQVSTGASGSVTVTGTYGTASLAGFIYDPLTGPDPTPEPPLIDVFAPQEGGPGDTITIYGLYFEHISSVQFGGITATSFTVYENGTYDSIRAVVGAGASGAVTINSTNGTDTRNGFTFIPPPPEPPVISGFAPQTGSTNATITISGKHFTSVTSVLFGGITAGSFTITNDSTIVAQVGAGATGAVTVNGASGNAQLEGFTFIPFISAAAPAIMVYPNPSTNQIVAAVPATTVASTFQLMDLKGNLIKTIPVGASVTQVSMNVSTVPPGMYKLVWNNGTQHITKTVMIMK